MKKIKDYTTADRINNLEITLIAAVFFLGIPNTIVYFKNITPVLIILLSVFFLSSLALINGSTIIG
ncbi:MAG: hypothetical protein GF416_06100 [Candidatus Altiarchaeales archaeon]|nr:hypothetical protein [Candidatus Altiarchaeales archaeon]MBD3416688.1 hypothetical protein [Candidatus Altiarchaeales archaeon]